MGAIGMEAHKNETSAMPKGRIKLAVSLHSADSSSVEFWPTMGTNIYGSKCNGEHCIHNDRWEEIKAHPENYTQCIMAGCTKTVTIDETSNSAIFSGIYGREAGILLSELNSDVRMWSSTGSNSDPTYPATLAAIKAGSDIPSAATMKIVSRADLGNPPLWSNDTSKRIFDRNGLSQDWWFSDRVPYNDRSGYIFRAGGYFSDSGYMSADSIGIAPAFSY